MDILILFGILIFANLGLTLRLFWLRGYDKGVGALEATPAAAVAVAAVAPPASTGFTVCVVCKHRVARWTLTATGPMCANCLPLETK